MFVWLMSMGQGAWSWLFVRCGGREIRLVQIFTYIAVSMVGDTGGISISPCHLGPIQEEWSGVPRHSAALYIQAKVVSAVCLIIFTYGELLASRIELSQMRMDIFLDLSTARNDRVFIVTLSCNGNIFMNVLLFESWYGSYSAYYKLIYNVKLRLWDFSLILLLVAKQKKSRKFHFKSIL